ncbi:hypothetical protein [Bacteroides fragilis]|jgi:hypothetical protein|uniref:hypothetical protein n=1 Tax=Bacteroides fragilis TaxID=817 RepID=UPI00202FFD95|nr:hypothetical protein [Bacteroides fragilis]MCM0217502.1 hypothetical protein [Bacteroides fragilis]MCM0265999.1 hypothetical protein [Bacteroides fragilis]
MNRGQNIELAANAEVDNLCGLEGFDKTDMINMFASGATWADEHAKQVEGCDFCKQEEVITHNSKECDLSYDGYTLCVDIDIPLTWGSATGYYGFSINYCPFCGRKLEKDL